MMGIILAVVVQGMDAPALPTEEVIVVTGRRLSRVQYGMKVNILTGVAQCWITQSSGDPEIDRRMCEIAKACAKVKPRKREAIEACSDARKRELIATYVPRNEKAQDAPD